MFKCTKVSVVTQTQRESHVLYHGLYTYVNRKTIEMVERNHFQRYGTTVKSKPISNDNNSIVLRTLHRCVFAKPGSYDNIY